MTGMLILRHQLLRDLPRAFLISLVAAGLGANILGIFVALSARGVGGPATQPLVALEAVAVAALAGLLVKARPGARCRAWEAALPLDGPTLWRTHWAAVSIAAAAVVAATAGLLTTLALVAGDTARVTRPTSAEAVRMVLDPVAVALALAALAAAWRPAWALPDRVPGWRGRCWPALAGGVLLMLASGPLPWLPYVALAGAVAAAMRAGRAVPPALTWEDQGDGSAASAADGAAPLLVGAPWSAAPSRAAVWFTVGRMLNKWPVSLVIGLPMTAIFGMLLGGWAPDAERGDAFRWGSVAMSAYILLAFTAHCLEHLRRADHLPLARRTVLALLLAPGAAALVLGYGAARVAEVATGRVPAAFAFDGGADGAGLRVPPALWRVTAAGTAPTITAPWGESVTAASVPLVRGTPLRLWKPYTAPPSATPRFVAWQLGRAANAWYGVEADADRLAERWFVASETGGTALRDEGSDMAQEWAGMASPSGGPVFPVLVGAVFLLNLAASAIYFATFRPGATLVRTRIVFWTLMAALLGLHLGGSALLMGDVVEDWAVSGAVFGALRRLGGVGAPGWLLAWGVAVASVAAMWRLACRTLERAETLPRGGGCG